MSIEKYIQDNFLNFDINKKYLEKNIAVVYGIQTSPLLDILKPEKNKEEKQ